MKKSWSFRLQVRRDVWCMCLFDNVTDAFLIVMCSTPCVNGACIANDTCICAEGYTGSVCDVQSEYTKQYSFA